MSGTPWHTETLSTRESEGRRHKGNCKYFCHSRNQCNLLYERCRGSSHCPHYVKKDSERTTVTHDTTPSNSYFNSAKKDKNPINAQTAHSFLPGDIIRHTKFGKGTIIYVEGDSIRVKLNNGVIKELSVDYCEENQLIQKIK